MPPDSFAVERFVHDRRPLAQAYAELVQGYLASPYFGERWARHWMDVVHYCDTHGYEWDGPVKHA